MVEQEDDDILHTYLFPAVCLWGEEWCGGYNYLLAPLFSLPLGQRQWYCKYYILNFSSTFNTIQPLLLGEKTIGMRLAPRLVVLMPENLQIQHSSL